MIKLLIRMGTTAFVIAGSVAGVLMTTGSGPKSDRPKFGRSTRSADIAAFAHRPRGIARLARSLPPGLRPPAGAILVAVHNNTQVYLWRNTDGEDCLIHVTIDARGGAVCGPAAEVEEQGLVSTYREGRGAMGPGAPAVLRISALLPNGVRGLRFTDHDGSSYVVPVTDNVVEREDINLASISYTLPGGKTRTVAVRESGL
jgi:hypothetical protein